MEDRLSEIRDHPRSPGPVPLYRGETYDCTGWDTLWLSTR